jgi:hydrogenase maturation protein HypF
MAENHLNGDVIAITLDGTGYGTDGHIWGGEILTCSATHFNRNAHLSYIKMPGGDAAVREPWRMAASLLYQAFGMDFLDLDIDFIKVTDPEKLKFICQMIDKNLNSPLTSSAGRLFDAVSALLCICHAISYESQAAMEMEAHAKDIQGKIYDFQIIDHVATPLETSHEIDMIPAIRQMVDDLTKNLDTGHISAGFHNTLALAFCQAAERIGAETGLSNIVLSGGVFNNKRIYTCMVEQLTQKGFKVYTHSQVPTGDGGISLGQAVIAAAMEGK